jgi:hypothetical protein
MYCTPWQNFTASLKELVLITSSNLGRTEMNSGGSVVGTHLLPYQHNNFANESNSTIFDNSSLSGYSEFHLFHVGNPCQDVTHSSQSLFRSHSFSTMK